MSLISKRALPGALVMAAVATVISGQQLRAADVATGDTSETSLSEVIVTGTRTTGMEAAESPAPIQIVSAAELANTGSPDLMGALANVVPSFVVQGFGSDLANQTVQARIRGLSPNHVLVLINGKRRHTTANLAVLESAFQGGAGADLGFIPLAAIDHVEVLTEGAAAQYGSDAIAGVINIILKRNSSGGSVDANYGHYFDEGGTTGGGSGNIGFQPGDDTDSYLNVTGEVRNHGHSERGNIDPRVIKPTTFPDTNEFQFPGYPKLNLIQGDAEAHYKLAEFNAGATLPYGVEFYAFGTYGYKEANSYENYRPPDKAEYTNPTTGALQLLYPYGYNPQEQIKEHDYQITAGFKGAIADWNWDLASEYGSDNAAIYTIDSANNSLYAAVGSSPANFHDGTFITTQWTTTLDLNRDFDIGLAGPLNVAFGGEFRKESYQIVPGDLSSYDFSGAASFAGYAPNNATDRDRKNYAGYLDLAGKPIENLRVDLAGRFEHYSDFGSTQVGKLTARYDFVPEFAVRATVSTGFRAPTLAEEFYTGINVGPTTAFGQLAPDAAGSSLLGLGGGLQPEKSNNYSVGFVFRPFPSLSATLDVYDIEVRNRIVGTGNINGQINGVPVPGAENITAALIASGLTLDPAVVATGSTGINLFANGINTRTKGADFTLNSPQTYAWGHVDWSIGATWNETNITKVIASPAQLGGQPLFDAQALSDLSTASPKLTANFGAAWSSGPFSVTIHEIIYGPSNEATSDLGDGPTGTPIFYNTHIGTIPTTNLDLGLEAMKGFKIAIGAINLFNRYPEQIAPQVTATDAAAGDNNAVTKYPGFSPFGINGGFYYARATFRF